MLQIFYHLHSDKVMCGNRQNLVNHFQQEALQEFGKNLLVSNLIKFLIFLYKVLLLNLVLSQTPFRFSLHLHFLHLILEQSPLFQISKPLKKNEDYLGRISLKLQVPSQSDQIKFQSKSNICLFGLFRYLLNSLRYFIRNHNHSFSQHT